MTVDNQKRKLIRRVPTKTQLILHELIPQIPLFGNYEKIHYCLFKIKRNRKLFENRRKFVQGRTKMKMATNLLKS